MAATMTTVVKGSEESGNFFTRMAWYSQMGILLLLSGLLIFAADYLLYSDTRADTVKVQDKVEQLKAKNAQGSIIRQNLAATEQTLKEKREEFEANSNLWTKVCAVFCDNLGPGVQAEPMPEAAIECLTFSELSASLQSLTDRVFLDKPRSDRVIDSPKKRWPDYLTKVRRLRNEAAHLRNISFQDIEDLLGILNAVRRDQLYFLIVP